MEETVGKGQVSVTRDNVSFRVSCLYTESLAAPLYSGIALWEVFAVHGVGMLRNEDLEACCQNHNGA